MQLKKPQLLCKDNPDLANLVYPYYAIPKLDGIRCLINETLDPVSRTLKLIPNKKIQAELQAFSEYVFTITGIRHGFDGELICGSPVDKDVYRTTNSVVMSHDKTIPVKYFVFDIWSTGLMFDKRLSILQDLFDEHDLETKFPCVHFFNTGKICNDEEDVLAYEEHCINLGYEGLVLRNPLALYKQGRTSMTEENAYKLKRYLDDEALVVGMEPEYENTNEAFKNETGNTKRSTAQAGLKARETMGSLIVSHPVFGTFNIGTGFTQEERLEWWQWWSTFATHQESRTVKFKYFPIGMKDKPRHPVYLGMRNMEIDG